jgi:hypothetical protein
MRGYLARVACSGSGPHLSYLVTEWLLMLDRRIMFLAGSLLGVAGTASAQVAPPPGAAPATPAPATPAPGIASPVPAVSPPVLAAPRPPTAPGVRAALARPALDAALVQRAREARQTGKLIDVTSPAEVEGCRDLGSDFERSDLDGLTGRARIRVALRRIARARGASHMLYFEYSGGVVQTERGRFFDCTGDDLAASPPSLAPIVAPPPADGAVTASAPARLGAASVQLDILPAGAIGSTVQQRSVSVDARTAVGMTAALEYFLHPQIALGLAPGLVFGIKPDGEMQSASATQLDVRARLRFGQLQRDGLALSGYATLGGSWLFPPNDGDTSSGLSAGFGFGVSYPVRGGFLLFELGYQFGDQSIANDQGDIKLSTHLLHIGLGVGSYL